MILGRRLVGCSVRNLVKQPPLPRIEVQADGHVIMTEPAPGPPPDLVRKVHDADH